ncbi:MAG: ribose-5-phosphate isomerase RpiA [Methanobacteriota archaeon]
MAGPGDVAKENAARRACDFVESGMVLGLGTGSTADFALKRIAELQADGLKVSGVPTSERTMLLARQLSIPLTSLDENPELDVTLDGADEVDPQFRLVKGLGGALLREKVVAAASRRVVIMVDEGKLVPRLGRGPLPVEVLRFGWRQTEHVLGRLGSVAVLREREGAPFVSDNGNLVLDTRWPEGIVDPAALEARINNVPGVVDNGLFVDLATDVVVGDPRGARLLQKKT